MCFQLITIEPVVQPEIFVKVNNLIFNTFTPTHHRIIHIVNGDGLKHLIMIHSPDFRIELV